MSLAIEPFGPLVDRYDAFLIDQFGVLIDGEGAYPGAVDALDHIAQCGKPVVILSNSGKRAEPNCDRVVSFGFDRNHFKTVVTSGEIAYHAIKNALGRSIRSDARVMVLARQGDASPIADLGLDEADDPKLADVLLIVSRDLEMSRGDYIKLLTEFRSTGGKCLCLNPDLNMLTPSGIAFSAGAIAKLFEQLGGRVVWYGKPHSDIYGCALGFVENIPKNRVLCIGDSIHHDIIGGHDAGLATALVRQGVHADLSDDATAEILSELGVFPTHVLRSLSIV
ncbi:TIGR01459 family HAD-type hydrolase [Ruegeria sp. EL01]|jgi:HAD superfamily hydrolase (TIGR01459 family)|uniref:TIGR01459 family HAD-type hydrolase n=1 Tax=Ruegeria sp. EL01 TaxID=2107578 RepID=UPI000EA7F288|nr:TIGR01459 family HAD-type hydrolase [Ruegeria sp. EL01]